MHVHGCTITTALHGRRRAIVRVRLIHKGAGRHVDIERHVTSLLGNRRGLIRPVDARFSGVQTLRLTPLIHHLCLLPHESGVVVIQITSLMSSEVRLDIGDRSLRIVFFLL